MVEQGGFGSVQTAPTGLARRRSPSRPVDWPGADGQRQRGAAAPLLEAGRPRESAMAPSGATNPPVHPYDFPDPPVITVADTYLAYGTNGPTGNVRILSSTDLRSWQIHGEAPAGVPPRARDGKTGTPSVTAMDGRYVLHAMYETALGPCRRPSDRASVASGGGLEGLVLT